MRATVASEISRLRTRVARLKGETPELAAVLSGMLDVQAELDRQVRRASDDADRALRGPYAD